MDGWVYGWERLLQLHSLGSDEAEEAGGYLHGCQQTVSQQPEGPLLHQGIIDNRERPAKSIVLTLQQERERQVHGNMHKG